MSQILNPLNLVYFLAIGMAVTVMVNHLVLSLSMRFEFKYFKIALLSAVTIVYLSLSHYLHTTPSLEAHLLWGKFLPGLYLIQIGLFLYIFRSIGNRPFDRSFQLMLGVTGTIFCLNLFLPNGIIYQSEGLSVHNIASDDSFSYFMLNGKENAFYPIILMVFYALVLFELVSSLRKAPSAKMRVLVTVFSVYLLSNFYDIAIDLGLLKGVYLSELAFVPLLLIFSWDRVGDLKKKKILQEELLKSEESMRNLINSLKLAIIKVDETGVVSSINPYSQTILNPDFLDGHLKKFVLDIKRTKENEILVGHYDSGQYNLKAFDQKSEADTFVLWSWVHEPKNGSSLLVGLEVSERVKSRRSLEIAIAELKQVKLQLEEENTYLKVSLNKKDFLENQLLTGSSDEMIYVKHCIGEVGPTDSAVLIQGETGVGKELVAESIWRQSPRSEMPFIKVNCAALPGDLIESELFGHVKGAFTGALRDRKGKFELADGGTLFLDEIGEMPKELQPKLLRALQTGEFTKLGSEIDQKVDVRIVTATNKNLKEEVDQGNFRGDLYYRLAVYPITIPPLRDRIEDLEELVVCFIDQFSAGKPGEAPKLTKAVLNKFLAYNWPGNIRELRNVIERAIISSKAGKLIINEALKNSVPMPSNENMTLEELQRNHIVEVINKHNWKISGKDGAAQTLGVNESTLRSKMKKMGISRPISLN